VLKPVIKISGKSGNVISTAGDNGFFQWTNPYTLVDTLIELPSKADKVSLQMYMISGIKTGEINVDDASIEIVKNLPPVRKDAILAQVKKDTKGNPRLLINGKVRPPSLYSQQLWRGYLSGVCPSGKIRAGFRPIPDEPPLGRPFRRND